MTESEIPKCPVCGKTVLPLSTLTRHVEECLLRSETRRETRAKPFNECNGDSHKSFFSLMKSSSKVAFNRTQNSPQTDQKRVASSLAGKSDSSPPGKRPKLEDPKKGASAFFEPRKDNVKQTARVSLKPVQNVSKELTGNQNKSTVDPAVKPVSLDSPSNQIKSQNPVIPVSVGHNINNEKASHKREFVPLAERMRPCGLQDYLGQTKVVGSNCLLRSLLEANEVPSMILWGPPGCGKTSLAHVIATGTKKTSNTRFVTLSATTSGINDVKEVIKVAKNEQRMFKRKTILFMDEIHRFNKSQQDTFLPHVENGTITLIGATTENPSFHLNTALLSRCRVFVLEKLSSSAIQEIIFRAIKAMGLEVVDNDDSRAASDCCEVIIDKDAVIALSNLCDGDARVALNGLQLAVQSRMAASKQPPAVDHDTSVERSAQPTNKAISSNNAPVRVSVAHIKEGLQRTHLLYDKKGDEHYNIISALHKSMRGSDENASLYWLARMLCGGEDPLYIARRLVRFASEDVGLADPTALNQAVAAYQACHFIGMPECEVILAQAAVYLARAPKSIEVYGAYNKAKQCIKDWEGPQPSVPLHIRNAPTKLMKNLGYGAGYIYNPHVDGPVDQTYLPPELDHVNFFGNETCRR